MTIASKQIFSPDGKPYDSEVEWIDITKTRLDTHFVPSQNFKLKFKFRTSSYSQDWSAMVRTDQSSDPALSHSGGSSTCHIQQFGTMDYISFNTLADTEVEWTISGFSANNTSKSLSHGTWSPGGSVRFGPHSSPNVERLYWLQAYDGDELVRDFIPVRVGDIGYFYDRISGEIVGNEQPEGSFAVGPDMQEDER